MWQDISYWTLALCIIAAFLAGFVDAVAGGGGLIQLPVLLLAFPQQALATVSGTNKMISIVGTTVAARTYAKRIPVNRKFVAAMALCAFAGSAGGAALVTKIDRETFEPILLVVLIVVAIVTLRRRELGSVSQRAHRGVGSASMYGFGIGFYDGIMGPGTGMFLVFGLIAYIGMDFLTSSAMAKFVNVATNAAALFIFIPTNHILWPIAAFMAPANLIGGWIGARTALNRGSAFVRIVFLVMMGLMIIRLVMSL